MVHDETIKFLPRLGGYGRSRMWPQRDLNNPAFASVAGLEVDVVALEGGPQMSASLSELFFFVEAHIRSATGTRKRFGQSSLGQHAKVVQDATVQFLSKTCVPLIEIKTCCIVIVYSRFLPAM
jgi:hypothetical protein